MGRQKKIEFVEDENGCYNVISHTLSNTGYPKIYYNNKHGAVHRYMYEQAFGALPKDIVVRHKCDNPKCCRLDHLEIGTYADNSRDMVERNRQAKGETHGMHKLTETLVRAILAEKDLTQYEIAAKYEISQVLVSELELNKIWKHIPRTVEKHRTAGGTGSKRGAAKLVESDVYEIRASTKSNRQLAKVYGVDRTTISNIRTRRTWGHLEENKA